MLLLYTRIYRESVISRVIGFVSFMLKGVGNVYNPSDRMETVRPISTYIGLKANAFNCRCW